MPDLARIIYRGHTPPYPPLDGMAVFGGYSVTAEYEIGRLLMEAKALEFGEGTSDLHTKMVAEYALGIRKL